MEAPPVQYVTTADGYSIAYSVAGEGTPWVIVPPGFHHLHTVLEEESMRAWIHGLAARFRLVRYDSRGQGLSTRGLKATHTSDDFTLDLETVMDRLALPQVVLHGIGSSAHMAVRYAAKHPDRVRALIVVHTSITSEPWSPVLMDMLAGADWEVFLRTMTNAGRSIEAARASKDRLRQMVTQEDFALRYQAHQRSNIVAELRQVRAPALVLHLREVERPSLADCAAVAALIPYARLAEVPASPGPWYWGDFEGAIPLIEAFLSEVLTESADAAPGQPDSSRSGLSSREIEVLRLLAAGRSNQQIADELVISLNTVRRHVSNVFDKTGAANRAQAAVYAKERGLA